MTRYCASKLRLSVRPHSSGEAVGLASRHFGQPEARKVDPRADRAAHFCAIQTPELLSLEAPNLVSL